MALESGAIQKFEAHSHRRFPHSDYCEHVYFLTFVREPSADAGADFPSATRPHPPREISEVLPLTRLPDSNIRAGKWKHKPRPLKRPGIFAGVARSFRVARSPARREEWRVLLALLSGLRFSACHPPQTANNC